MTNEIIKDICDERKLGPKVCGRCAKWGNEHTDVGRPVYTLKCDKGGFTKMHGTCSDFVEG